MNTSAYEFFNDFGREIGLCSGEETGAILHFFQRLSIACSATTQFCCTRVSLQTTIRTSSSSRYFV